MSETAKHDLTAEVDASLQAWRRESGQLIFVLMGVAVVLPMGAWAIGYQLPEGWYWIPTMLVELVLAATAILASRLPQVVRVWLFLAVIYVSALRGLLWYDGAMPRVWLVGAPVLALILAGPRSGLAASGISVALVVLHMVGALTGVADNWRVVGFDDNAPRVIVSRTVMWLVFIVPFLVLLRRSYLFQLRTLAAQRATFAQLEEQSADRTAALESLARAAAERERLEREIARAADEERRRLGHDLHDGVSQQLAGALLRCSALEERLASEASAAVADVQGLGKLLEATMDEVHEVARSLSPLEMDPRALGPALAGLARRATEAFGVRCDFRQAGDVRLRDSEQTLHLYRIAQEAVNNAGKHAHAQRIALSLAAQDGHLELAVEDDGRGMPAQEPGTGLGLRIMAFRAQRIGGTLVLERAVHGGTRVVCRIPSGALHAD